MKDPILEVASPAKWDAWLKKNHRSSTGVLLKLMKKSAPTKNLSYAEALDVALIWGWIDSVKYRFDAHAFLQRFGPRRAQSPWSKINCAKIEVLIAAGKMQPSGLEEVERAKKDGRWDRAYAGAKTAEVPQDFTAALAKNPKANAFFQTISRTNRFAILYRIHEAKKPETRAARIEKFVAMCARGETVH